ncbi:DHBP synthase RibB-like alpha/beta domain-containing protein [Dipodascopsis uninucleata]
MMSSSSDSSRWETRVLPVHAEDIKFGPKDEIPTIDSQTETYKNLNEAVNILKTAAGPVAFPTETVYGLGASALSTNAVRQIFAAKNRPSDNPLIVHVSSLNQLERVLHTKVPKIYDPLIEKFWPGPLTIILPLPEDTQKDGSPILSPACTPGQSTFGVRMPSNVISRSLIALSDLPLAAPSANASTKPSPTRAEHVYEDMNGRIPIILDGGSTDCSVGLESTVVDGTVTPPAVLRPGGVTIEAIRSAGGDLWKDVITGKSEAGKNEAVRTPGMKYRHYSPRARVITFIGDGNGCNGAITEFLTRVEPGIVIGLLQSKYFDHTLWDDSLQSKLNFCENLGTTGPEISHNIFSALRNFDKRNVDVILVEGVDESDEGAAIMNRLRKASSEIFENGKHIKKTDH